MEARKWTFANIVLVRGQSYSVGPHRFLAGRTVRVTNSQLADLLRGNSAFSTEDHYAEDKPSPFVAMRVEKPLPENVPSPRGPVVPVAEMFPEPSGPPLEPASGIPIGAFVVTTESKPAGKKVLKKKTRVED